jgi:hypothetical protein
MEPEVVAIRAVKRAVEGMSLLDALRVLAYVDAQLRDDPLPMSVEDGVELRLMGRYQMALEAIREVAIGEPARLAALALKEEGS